ncbi:MAG: TOTE conflict system archaeo-eukaryotic primase domain-containing protein [Egibacteraceae bacterium]
MTTGAGPAPDDDRARRELAEAQRELARLRAENDRLRGLLGMDGGRAVAHLTEPEPTLFADAQRLPRVDNGSSPEQKLALFRALFAGRDDVYALRWENARSGKTGWSPAVRGGWPRSKDKHREYLAPTADVVAGHLTGCQTVGLYPLLAGDTCRLLACDFDGRTWALDALAYTDACQDAGVPAALERSRSGDGAHVWVFFTAPVPAASARGLGAALLREAMDRRAELDLASYDRLFPAQDFPPKGSFGNLIALPLQGECRKRGTTVFLDPSSLQPWGDQWAFLGSVGRLASDTVSGLVERMRPLDVGPTATRRRRAIAGRLDAPVPPSIRCQLGGMTSIDRTGVPPHLLAALKHLASLHNPVFYERERLRRSTWTTPRFIRCYTEDLERLHLPRGLLHHVDQIVRDAGSALELSDRRSDVDPLALHFQGTLTPQQQRAVEALGEHELGTLVAPPGNGKTVMACALIARHAVPTLVIVDRKPLLEQWQARLASLLGLDASQIGTLGAGKDRRSGVIDIAMIQSLTRRDRPDELLGVYGLVVVDECHHLPAVSFEACVRHVPVRRWLGLTATPYRRDGLEGIIAMQCGPIRHEIAAATTPAARTLNLQLVTHETSFDPDIDDAASIQEVFRRLVDDDERSAAISDDVADALARGRNCLVLTQWTEHIDRLCSQLTADGASIYEPLVLVRGPLLRIGRRIFRPVGVPASRACDCS